jgi:hypothetical protein
MSKPRVVIPIVVQFSVRYALRTGLLEQMGRFAQPIVLLRWEDSKLQQEMEAIGVEVYQLPQIEFRPGYTRIKRQVDMWHRKQLRSPSTAIDAYRMKLLTPRTLRMRARDAFYRLNLKLPHKTQMLLKKEEKALQEHTNIGVFDALLQSIRADAVFSLTPYFAHEQLLLRAAEQRGIPLCTSIISFDNLTTRGWIPVVFDAYFLWNHYNADELLRGYPEALSSRIEIVGAPQFDFYWDPSYIWDEATWRARLHLPADRPVLLFGAGHYLIVPHEPHWLQQLDDAVEAGTIPEKPIILFRRHPNDPLERWVPVLERAKHVVYDDPWKNGPTNLALTNIYREDIEKLASTLAHSQVHINASSTMTVDGAIFDRPQIGPAYDDQPGRRYDRITKDLYLREHYLPITNSGGLTVVSSRDEMIGAVRSAIRNPAHGTEGRNRIVHEICTYDDGLCTDRVSRAIKAFLTRT